MSKKTTTKRAAKTKAITKKAKEPKAKKVRALDAAAQVLSGSKEPMNCEDLIEAMAKKGVWTSPGGKSAMPRSIARSFARSRSRGKNPGF